MDEQASIAEPTSEMLEKWFADYGSLFSIQIQDQAYLYRRLTRREYRLLLMIDDEVTRANELAETVMLWPPNFQVTDGMLAGIPEAISRDVMKNSGFGDDMKERFEFLEKRVTEDIEPQMEAIIEYVFGDNGGKFDKYQDWSHEELFDSYQRALWILKVVEAKQHLTTAPEQPKGKTMTKEQVLEMVKKQTHNEGGNPHEVTMDEAMAKYRKSQREKALQARTQTQQPPANRPPPRPPTVQR